MNLIPLKTALVRLGCKKTKIYELMNAEKIRAYKQDGQTLVDSGQHRHVSCVVAAV